MIPRIRFWLPSVAAVFVGCSAFKADEPTHPPDKPLTQAPKLVGRIASIPPDRRFVLIQSYGSWNIPPGTILTTRGLDERSANLLVTGESLGQFAAADIQSGSLDIGDAVYSQHAPKAPEPPALPSEETEVIDSQQGTNAGNVQKNS